MHEKWDCASFFWAFNMRKERIQQKQQNKRIFFCFQTSKYKDYDLYNTSHGVLRGIVSTSTGLETYCSIFLSPKKMHKQTAWHVHSTRPRKIFLFKLNSIQFFLVLRSVLAVNNRDTNLFTVLVNKSFHFTREMKKKFWTPLIDKQPKLVRKMYFIIFKQLEENI